MYVGNHKRIVSVDNVAERITNGQKDYLEKYFNRNENRTIRYL